METRIRPAAVCLAAGVISALLATGCGGGSDSATVAQPTSANGAPQPPSAEQPLSSADLHGRALFVQRCGSCHTLSAAGTTGQLGPDLGNIPLTEADVLRAVRIGGGPESRGGGGRTGNMPRNLVTGKDAKEVAAFVASSGPGAGTP
jgi:mono/diheme cytochrome c family protein